MYASAEVIYVYSYTGVSEKISIISVHYKIYLQSYTGKIIS